MVISSQDDEFATGSFDKNRYSQHTSLAATMKLMRRRRRRNTQQGAVVAEDNGRRLKYDSNNPNGVCRWCNARVQPPRRTFCNNSCVHEYLLRSNNQYMRTKVWERDRGVCAICRVRTTTIGKAILAANNAVEVRRVYAVPPQRKVWRRKFSSAVFDVDHIQPVVAGGGQCGLDNLRTLCLACHKAVTWSACLVYKKKRSHCE